MLSTAACLLYIKTGVLRQRAAEGVLFKSPSRVPNLQPECACEVGPPLGSAHATPRQQREAGGGAAGLNL